MLNRTPKVYIVYCHPSEKSITNTIKQGYIDGLEEINVPTQSQIYMDLILIQILLKRSI